MEFLADENFPLPSIELLRKKELKIKAVIEDFPGASDLNIINFAHNEDSIILTFDSDFGKLIFHQSAPLPAGIVYFRFLPKNPLEPAKLFLKVLAKDIHLENRITVLKPDKIRQRKLKRV